MTISATTVRQAPNLTAAFEQACRRHPNRVAIRDRGQSVTYRQLAHRVEEIAAGLASVSSPPGRDSLIAVALEPGTDAVCAVLAALAADRAYLPLDASSPEGYLADVLADARPHAVIARDRRAGFGSLPAAVLDIDELAARGRDRTVPQHGARADGQDPAYAVFTSGSTGRPKGVLLPHTALLHSTAARIDAYGTPERVPLLHSPAVDVYTGTLFWALLSGATVVIAPAGLRDVPATARLLHDEKITDLVYLSSLYPVLLDCLDAVGGPPPELRRVMIGSERWGESVIDRHAALLPGVELHNEYGPTETAVWSSGTCVWNGAGRRAPLTIGRPVDGTGYRLLDADALPVTGQRGELYITGAQLAIGYLGQPGLTAERFVTLADGTRAYRTGDLAERTDDGAEFVFAGRADRQLKVQGVRIEPAHVESVLMSHPHVGLAHVTARHDPAAGSVLVAYLTPRADAPRPDTAVVAAFAAELLPAAMVPGVWMVLQDLPRTAAGKIDEGALPAPPTQAGAGGSVRDGDAPADEVEHAVAVAAAGLLGGRTPGVTCDLRQMGASSLVLIRLAAFLTAEFGVDVPVSALFTQPTIRQIAAHVRTASSTDRPPLLPTHPHEDGTPLSAQQQQIWFLGQLAPDSLAYNTQCSLHLHGPLDVKALEAALSLIVERHEILRTTFHDRGTGPVQTVHEPWTVRLSVIDLTELPEDERHGALAQHISAGSQTLFDVGRLPLVRWQLYRLGADAWTLFQSEHHFVHDGWSAVLLLREIRDAYTAFATGRTPRLPDLPVQYRDFAAWQHAWTQSADYARQRAYWQRTLAGAPEQGVTFAEDFPRPGRQTFHGACVRADIPAATVDTIDALAAQHGVTRFAAFLTAFTLLVRSHTGASDLVIGSALANRREKNTEHLLGMFVNALPLRLNVREDDTIAAAAAHAMDVLLGAQDHQEFPLTEIIKDLGVRRDPARNPLFQVMFAFHDSPRPVFDAAGVRGRLHIDHNGSAKNDVNVVCVPRPPAPGSALGHDGAEVLWEYNTDLFTADTAQHLLDSFVRILHTLTDPRAWQQPATSLDVLDPAQSARIRELATGPSAAPLVALHEAVDARIPQCPEAVAVVQGGRTLTYTGLDLAAAALEAQLDAAGVGPGARVAVACGPGPEHIVALLATLRRGAAYVCLDPDEPVQRAAAILADAQPTALICTTGTANRIRSQTPELPLFIADGDARPTGAVPPRPTVRADAPAYLVYTSGSTGQPKAVVATHEGAVTALTARTAFTGAEPPCTLVTLPLQFDVAASMIFWTLSTGGTVVFPDTRDDVRDPSTVRRLIDAHRITRVNFVASYYRHFLAALPDGWSPALHTVAIGGERCTRELADLHAARLPGVILDNEYGPTEATVWCAAARLHDPGQPATGGRVTVGRPLAGYQLYVVDPDLRPVPIGARGELCVAGPAVAAGYLNQPELTAQRFVTPHSGPLARVRLLRTGDVGRLLPNGQFDVAGRVDDQVKIRGFRIELGEVQQCLAAHPDVTDACVIADHTTDPAGRLIAYLAAAHPGPDLAGTVRDWAADRLPAAMVPAAVVALDALPLTAAGKVDRAALPTSLPDPGTGEPGGPDDGGLSEVQRTVLSVWRELLPAESGRAVGLDAEWFALGGDSLLAIRAAAALREHGLAVSVSDVLHAATPRALAARLHTAPTTARDVSHRPGGTVLPLTGAQAWFFAQAFAEPHHFNQARLFPLPADAPAQPKQLRGLLEAVLARHDAFRTRFTRRTDGTWTAVLDEATGPAELAEHVLPPDADGPEQEALDAAHHGLDLEHGPLWRATLFTDASRGHRWLHLVAHHLITDAVSWDVLARDLHTAYAHGPDTLPTVPGISEELIARPPQGEEIGYWQDLARARTPQLCASGGERAPYGKLDHHTARLSTHATGHLLDTAREGASVPAMLLAALHEALAPLSRGDGLYVFAEGHGRHGVEAADQIVGWLTSLYPVHLTPARESRGLMDTARAFTQQLDAVPRHGVGFAAARYLAPASPLGRLLADTCMPEVTFNYLGTTAPAVRTVHGEDRPVVAAGAGEGIGADNILPTAVHVTARITDGTLHVSWSVDPGLFPPGAVEQASARMLGALEDAARLVPLAPAPAGQEAQPHFLIHPVDGQVHGFRPLAGTLAAAGWECYGLAADTGSDAATTIEDLAEQYVQRLRHVQPAGPYTLTGYSFGAAVAFAMAQALERAGDRVEQLVLLDPPPPQPDRDRDGMVLAGHLGALLPDRSREQIQTAVAAAAAAEPGQQLAVLIAQLALTEPADTFQLRRLPVLLRHHRALAAWQPHGTVERLHLVQPAATARHHLDGWLDHGRTVARSVVPGDHHTMLRDRALPHLAALYKLTARSQG